MITMKMMMMMMMMMRMMMLILSVRGITKEYSWNITWDRMGAYILRMMKNVDIPGFINDASTRT